MSLFSDARLVALLDLFTKAGHEMRVVGGAVRDEWLGLPIGDVDLATTALPEEVTKILESAGHKAVPTGVEFGTITAVIEGKPYEITTLREDIETDGRHAKVKYTRDWQKDAARRDFTINAMSKDASGNIHDYFDGQRDLREGRIVFVGDAGTRIREDYLRVLRFFRFFARYGRHAPDEATLSALKAAAPKIKNLARERIWQEIKKLLAAHDPAESWMLMMSHEVLPHVLPEANNLAELCSLLSYERMRKKPAAPNALLRLAALIDGKKALALELKSRLALSNMEAQKLGQYLENPLVSDGRFDTSQLSFCLYRYGFDLTEEFMVLAQARAAQFNWESATEVLEKWVPKSFPIKGEDLLALGLPSGPRVGEILQKVETWWMAQNFVPGRDACLAYAKSLIVN